MESGGRASVGDFSVSRARWRSDSYPVETDGFARSNASMRSTSILEAGASGSQNVLVLVVTKVIDTIRIADFFASRLGLK
jgi:hypothetical protein